MGTLRPEFSSDSCGDIHPVTFISSIVSCPRCWGFGGVLFVKAEGVASAPVVVSFKNRRSSPKLCMRHPEVLESFFFKTKVDEPAGDIADDCRPD